MLITPEYITSLKQDEIFVFGSNLAGMHGGGAARMANKRCRKWETVGKYKRKTADT